MQETSGDTRTKVFYFIPNLQQGGTERQILELIRNLPDRFEPILCLYHDTIFYRDELPADQPRYILGKKRMDLAGLEQLTRILRKEKPDIVHSFRDKSNFWARIAALRAGVPVIISSCRNRMLEIRHLLVERILSDRCQQVLVNSEGVRQELIHLARVRPERIKIIYNILDPEFFRPPSEGERSEARSHWRLSDKQPALLLPGRIGLQKNQFAALMAFHAVISRRSVPANTMLLLPGRKRDLTTAGAIKLLTRLPAIRDRVRFLGPQKNILSLYWAADALVMPSLWEGLSNAALEACSCGLPAVLSRAANVDRIVEPGVTGFEVPTWSIRPLIRALEQVLSLSHEERREMGRRGRERVMAMVAPTPNYMVEETVKIYDEWLSRT